jgi:hypothetical protein
VRQKGSGARANVDQAIHSEFPPEWQRAAVRRRLPFFLDPIEGKLKIEKGALVAVYRTLQVEAVCSIHDES